ncbi:MAG: hypothetical protein Tsb0020_26670 [Haliangiales bacterium]
MLSAKTTLGVAGPSGGCGSSSSDDTQLNACSRLAKVQAVLTSSQDKIVKDKVPPHIIALDAFQSDLETLRNHLVDVEAVAHAAEEALQDLPYNPATATTASEPYSDNQLGMGRLQTLVIATSTAARLALQETDQLVDRLYKLVESAGVTRDRDNGSSRANQSGVRVATRPERAPRTLLPLRESA